jgi:hypothetical protein
MSNNQWVIWASGVGSRQKNMSRPFSPNSTAAVSSTPSPSTARVPSVHLGQISSASNIKTAQSRPLVLTQSVIYILRIEGFSGYAALLATKGVKIPEARQTFAAHDHLTHRLWTKVIFLEYMLNKQARPW